MTVVAVFGLLFLERFDLVLEDFDLFSQLPNDLEGLFESILQRVVLLCAQLHLLLFDGDCLPQQQILVSHAFEFYVPVHEDILPERLQVRPGGEPFWVRPPVVSGGFRPPSE